MHKTTKEIIRQTWSISKIQHTYCIAVWFALFLAKQHISIFLINIINLSVFYTLDNAIARGSVNYKKFGCVNYTKFGYEKGYSKNLTADAISDLRNTQPSAIRKQLTFIFIAILI